MNSLKALTLARIFHTDSSRGAANPDTGTTGGQETAGETALEGGRPKRARRAEASESAQTSIATTAVCFILPEEQFETDAVSIRCSQAAAESG
jgi:hypothetical protein